MLPRFHLSCHFEGEKMRLLLNIVAAISITACASKSKKAVEIPPPPPQVPASEVQSAHEPAKAADTHASPHAHAEIKGIDPETSLRWLNNGNTRFVKHRLRKDGQSSADIAKLSKGQAPHAVVLSCSDSRVPPEIVFDQKLGELFTVRTAGETLAANAVGSIEYAAEHLGSRLIVVMGHTSCGAVKAAFSTLDGASAGTPSLDGLVQDIHPRIATFKGQSPSENFEKESWANVHGVIKDMTARSKMLAEMQASGKIKIVPALYDLKTGKVTFQ